MSEWTDADIRWMRLALRLAARGFTPPNPMVGCVLVKDGAAVGQGYHRIAGAPHGEAAALLDAGEKARGATAYVNLEPCSHFGRTPPCADALIKAGVARVVAACVDPNANVQGAGIERLRAAGIPVTVGLLEREARRLNEAFFHFHATGLPFVTLKAAVTLDGKVATRTGDSRWITGEKARAWVHRLRAQTGAILVGVGTVLADDPLLTARIGRGAPRQPLRIVLDPHLRTPVTSQLVTTARQSPVLVVASDHADPRAAETLRTYGVEILMLPTNNYEQFDLQHLLRELARREVISLLVEGGGATHARFLSSGIGDRLLWFIAPKIVGGAEAPTSVEGEGVDAMAEAGRFAIRGTRRLGADLLIEAVPEALPGD